MELKKIANAIDNNKILEDQDFLDYAKFYISCNKLDEYIKDIEFVKDSDEGMACYCYNKKKIKIYRDSIYEYIELFECLRKIKNSMYTAILVNSLYHESTHAKQCKIVQSGEKSLQTKIFINNINNYDASKTYNYSIELNARIIAYNQMMKLLRGRIKYVILPSEISLRVDNFLTFDFIEDLKEFYEEKSPVEKMKINLSEYDYQNYNNYEKILLGLPLSEKVKEKVLTLNAHNARRLKNI